MPVVFVFMRQREPEQQIEPVLSLIVLWRLGRGVAMLRDDPAQVIADHFAGETLAGPEAMEMERWTIRHRQKCELSIY